MMLLKTRISHNKIRCFFERVIFPAFEFLAVKYLYDGQNRLIGRKTSDSSDMFVQSGWSIASEKDKEGRKTYYTGVSSLKDGVATFSQFDHLGNTRLVTDEDGNVIHKLNYEAYGKAIDESGNLLNSSSLKSIPDLFIGSSRIRYDFKTDLHYMRFRWYLNDLMRFASPDPLMYLNKYNYAFLNPIMAIDPTGLYVIFPGSPTQQISTPAVTVSTTHAIDSYGGCGTIVSVSPGVAPGGSMAGNTYGIHFGAATVADLQGPRLNYTLTSEAGTGDGNILKTVVNIPLDRTTGLPAGLIVSDLIRPGGNSTIQPPTARPTFLNNFVKPCKEDQNKPKPQLQPVMGPVPVQDAVNPNWIPAPEGSDPFIPVFPIYPIGGGVPIMPVEPLIFPDPVLVF